MDRSSSIPTTDLAPMVMRRPPGGLGRERAETPLRHATNTTHERRSLDRVINMSDAHCRQLQTHSQQRIIARLPDLFAEAQARPQLELESEFIATFMDLAGEAPPPDTRRHLLSYSSSCAITMLASYCARRHKRVALIEPVFDNIPSILHREGVEVTAIHEQECIGDALHLALAAGDPDAVWVVVPNNPTGWTLTEAEFRDLVACCAADGRVLVLDMSFRFFSPDLASWAQYDILESSGVSYVVLEDTGKTWSTNELKIGMAVCSPDLYEDMYRLHDDLLQGVSPLTLRVVTEFIMDSRRLGRDNTILRHVRENRAILRSFLADAPLEFLTSLHSPVSVDWIRLCGEFDGDALSLAVAEKGVQILSGTNFYWSHPDQGRQFIRLPLARDPDLVRRGAQIIRDVARSLEAATSPATRLAR